MPLPTTGLPSRAARWLIRLDARSIAGALWLVAALVAAHAIYYLLVRLSAPVLGQHAFRQSQTALTAYWMRFDGFRLAYETPVLGAPWSIPFEFPLYQGIVACLFALGLPLEVAGRLTSFAFMLACVWPFAIFRKHLDLPAYAVPIMTILFLASPFDIFWGRAVLIETCALFLALLWLAMLVAILSSKRGAWPVILATAAAGCAAVLQKSTTFPAFGLIGGVYLLVELVRSVRSRDMPHAAYLIGIGMVTCLLPLLAGAGWVAFTDQVKLQNPAAGWLTSRNLADFNFGTWSQRYSWDLWSAISRAIQQILGLHFGFALAAITGAVLAGRRYRLWVGVAFSSFFVPFALFTNLHIDHEYYQVAAAVFLVAATALALTAFVERELVPLAAVLLCVTVSGQFGFFDDTVRPWLLADHRQDDEYRIARLARERVRPDEAIIVSVGDWSSVIDLYSERKGIAVTPAMSAEMVDRLFDDPSRFLAGMRAGAIVTCPPYEPPQGAIVQVIENHLKGRQILGSAGQCKLLAAP